jgi:hypothetical protein
MKKHLLIVLVLLLFLTSASTLNAFEGEGLKSAWKNDAVVRSTYFVKGMSCRACTMLLDRRLFNTPGIYWARFNYPIRLFTIYHDPNVFTNSELEELAGKAGEIEIKLISQKKAVAFSPTSKSLLARWEGGELKENEITKILAPFKDFLTSEMGVESYERLKVEQEILGEALRHRIFLNEAKKAGFRGKTPADIPALMLKDFYWPTDLRPLTRDESTVMAFLDEAVLVEPAHKDIETFDAYLYKLWRDKKVEFFGEYAEIK